MIDLAKLPLPREPYRGIEPFRLLDWPIFLERAEDVEHLQSSVSLFRGVLLYGESGAGKSSLLNAGLLPYALRRQRWPERIRVQPSAGGELVIERIALCEPSAAGTPEPAAASGLPRFLPSRFTSADTDERVVCSCAQFQATLHATPGPAPLLIFDQFEELVTLFEEAPSNRVRFEEARQARAAIEALLVDLLLHEKQPLKIVFAFREDYLASLIPVFRRIPGLTDQELRVGSPPLASLRRLIRGPFEPSEEGGEQRGLPGHFPNELDEELTQKIVAGFNERSQSGALVLSEVQTLCQMLWRKPELREAFRDPRRFAEQQRRGDAASEILARIFPALSAERRRLDPNPSLGAILSHILAQYTREAVEKLPRQLWNTAIALLGNLVTPRGTRNVISEDNLLEAAKRDRTRAGRALDELREKAGIVRRTLRSGTTYYELTSEFLIPWIIEVRWRFQIISKLKRMLLVIYGGALIVFVCVAGTLWAFKQKDRAQSAEQTANEQRRAAIQAKADSEAAQRDLEEAIASGAAWREGQLKKEADLTRQIRELQSALGQFGKVAKEAELSVPETVQALVPQAEAPVSKALTAVEFKHEDDVWMAAFFDEDRKIVTASADKFVMFWDAATGAEVVPKWKASDSRGGVTCVAIDRQQRFAISGSAGESVRVFNLEKRRQIQLPELHKDTITWIAFDPAGTHVVTTSADRTARVWNVPATGEGLAPTPLVLAHFGIVSFAAFSADGRHLLTSCDDGFARWWTLATPKAKPLTLSTRSPVRRATVSPAAAGTRQVAVPSGNNVLLWQPETNDVAPLAHETAVISAVYSPDGRRLATASADGVCRIWDVSSYQPAPLATETSGRVLRLAWSGERLALAGEDGSVEIWRTPAGNAASRERRFQAHEGPVWWLAFSADARRLITTSAFSEENLPSAKGRAATSGRQLRLAPDNRARVWTLE